MKKVRELKSWISGYEQIKQSVEDLAVLFDFAKEGEATEEEVDAHYADTLELVEKLELKNMLRGEADQMSCVLKINSGAGGTESQDWASMLMRMYIRWAEANNYKAAIRRGRDKNRHHANRRRLCLRLSERGKRSTPACASLSIQCPREAHDLFCIDIRYAAG